jgi:hypothetical protein
MSNTLYARKEVFEILGRVKKYKTDTSKAKEPVNYELVHKMLAKSKSNEKFERAKFSIFDEMNSEFIVIIQKTLDADYDDFTAILFAKQPKEEIFLCRLDYNDEHHRRCKREQFGEIRASKYHFHIHCKECYETMGQKGLENIAFSIEADSDNIDFVSFLKLFFEKINLQTAKNFALLLLEMNYDG